MRFRDGVFLSILAVASSPVFGQTDDSGRALPVVTVRGAVPERFLAGQKSQRIDSVSLEQFRFQTLTELLSATTPIAFKVYGPGQLSTASFRGTSANHTALLWNGININQPTLGQTDFSTLPVAGFDQLSVQYGASSSCLGSDAVGGSVLLSDTPDWKQPGLTVTAAQQFGSFQNRNSQIGLRFSSRQSNRWQVAGKTFFYTYRFPNRYPYRERGHYFVEQSNTDQKGFIQDFYFRNDKNHRISLNLWFTDNDLIVSPFDTVVRERTRSQSRRALATYEFKRLTIRAGWIRDVIDFARGNFNRPSHSETDRYIGRAEHEFSRNGGKWELTVRSGVEFSHYQTRVDGYHDSPIGEDRADLFLLSRLQTDRWRFSLNVRQAFVSRFDPPPAPSVGAEYLLLRQNRHSLTGKISLGRSYRVPTLNERYWKDLGNPNLRPENGFNAEAGLSGESSLGDRLKISGELTGFRNRIDDWSYWNPEFGYRVENLQLVVARGIEWSANLQYVHQKWKAGITPGYAYTRSSQERVYNTYAQDIVGKQLAFVPLHSARISVYAALGSTRLTVWHQAVSRRYTTFDNIQYLKGYQLTNLILETQLTTGIMKTRIQGQVNNLFDTLYLNVKRNAMPGRNFAVNLIIHLNTRKS
ncbi:TonB-dependent receptor plug domain-containing protein [Larkinella soli]|uniref:TonB-dependent receptor plug domain-containing protein n=1 Tax=Larkinella soli TaxID=1770527 RepID=UPI000FFBD163|nr:TonB-dependent receptor plug domain-containing protein [Larkinella soli]